jgi:2'-5' RNA ligase
MCLDRVSRPAARTLLHTDPTVSSSGTSETPATAAAATAEGPRRVLVAVVPGVAGQRIQAWREAHDAWRSRLLPPHLTLCYRPPRVPASQIEAQVRHAFPRPVAVRLGGVTELPNRDRTLVVEVLDAADLDRARRLLFDTTFAEMGGYREWPWHITWVRYGIKCDSAALLALAAHDLSFDQPWTIDTVSLLELRAGRYESVAEWRLEGRPTGCL